MLGVTVKGSACFYLMTDIYPDDKVILVMDNASFHTSGMSQAALSLYEDQLQVVYLPRYCSFLNPIERFWKHLKELVNANRLHRDLEDLIACSKLHLNLQNDINNPLRFVFSKNI